MLHCSLTKDPELDPEIRCKIGLGSLEAVIEAGEELEQSKEANVEIQDTDR